MNFERLYGLMTWSRLTGVVSSAGGEGGPMGPAELFGRHPLARRLEPRFDGEALAADLEQLGDEEARTPVADHDRNPARRQVCAQAEGGVLHAERREELVGQDLAEGARAPVQPTHQLSEDGRSRGHRRGTAVA